jgi:hypothetical protein
VDTRGVRTRRDPFSIEEMHLFLDVPTVPELWIWSMEVSWELASVAYSHDAF